MDTLARVFGAEGNEGLIRIGPLAAVVAEERSLSGQEHDGAGQELPEPTVRHHVSLERARRQAAPQRLFQNHVTPAVPGLRFCGEIRAARPLDQDEQDLLRAAASITDQIGAGRGRGLGLIELHLERICEEPENAALELPADSPEVVLVFEACEPLQLGALKDVTNLSPSKEHLDGSVVRGAIAQSLMRLGLHEHLDEVLGGADAVQFGDGRAADPSAIPAPLTLREPKRGGRPTDEAIARCEAALTGRLQNRDRDTRPVGGSVAFGCAGWEKITLKRRIVTRTARDHRSGKAAQGKLYSLEVLDPLFRQDADSEREELLFFVPVSGSPGQLALVVRAAAAGLLVGRARSRGFGRLRLVGVERPADLGAVELRHQRWASRLERRGVDNAAATGILLTTGPIATTQELLLRRLADFGLELVDGVSRRRPGGGWNSNERLPRTVTAQFVPGSTFIVKMTDGRSALEALQRLEEQGIGPGRCDGWGRVVACHPVHIDCCKEA
jgi:hypothetical protein